MAEKLELFGTEAELYVRQDSGEKVELADNSAAKRFRPIDRNQNVIRPVNVDKLVEPDHPVRAIWAMVCLLDWSRFERDVKVVEGGKGRSGWDPRLLAALWIYAYSQGVNAARELARMCAYEPGCQWLTGMQEVNHHSLSDFRVNDKEAQDELFKQILGQLSAEGLADLQRVTQDGTKIRVQASGNSFHTRATLQEHLKLAEEHLQAMGDPDSEDASQRCSKARQRAMVEKKQRLERALQELEKFKAEKPEKKNGWSVSETEPEARVMKQPDGGFAASYNVQISTDALNKIIVAVETTQVGSDANQLVPALEAMENNTACQPKQMLADAAYIHNANIAEAAERGIDLIGPVPTSHPEGSLKKKGVSPEFYPDKFRYDEANNTFSCPTDKILHFQNTTQHEGRRKHYYRAKAADCHKCPFRYQCCPKNAPRLIVRSEDSEVVRAFKAKMETPEAKQIYRSRPEVAETPNAWIKDKFGLRRFRLRGLIKAGLEAAWACLTYNVCQWIRLSWKPRLAGALAGGGVAAMVAKNN